MRHPETRRVNSHRYPGYDYAQAGMVFLTICTQGKQTLFSKIEEGVMILSAAGEYVANRWQSIPQKFQTVEVDAFVVMPDHLHGILFTGVDSNQDANPPPTGAIVRWLKTSVLRDYALGVRNCGWEPYDRSLWQRDYYDRIIRNEAELEACRIYIANNPSRWWDAMNG